MKTKILNKFRLLFTYSLPEKWLRKKVREKKSTSLLGRITPNNYQYPKGSVRKFEYKDIKLELDIHDYVSHYLYFGFKDASHEKLMSLIRSGDTVLDIGTNFGTTILQFAKYTGEKGSCYGFEPDPVNFKICQANLQLNPFKNIYVDNIGLGNSEGSFKLIVDSESNRGCNKINIDATGKESHTVTVKVLDNWVKEHAVNKIDFIKIDVEGFEMNVLKGAEKVLQEHHPLLFIELDDHNLKLQNSSASELIYFLEQNGYSITHSETDIKISSTDDFSNTHFDIIARYA